MLNNRVMLTVLVGLLQTTQAHDPPTCLSSTLFRGPTWMNDPNGPLYALGATDLVSWRQLPVAVHHALVRQERSIQWLRDGT